MINKKINFKKNKSLLDIIYEDKEFLISSKNNNYLQIKENGEEPLDDDSFSGNIDDLPESVFLAIGDYLNKKSNQLI